MADVLARNSLSGTLMGVVCILYKIGCFVHFTGFGATLFETTYERPTFMALHLKPPIFKDTTRRYATPASHERSKSSGLAIGNLP
jgi:hypothetical protein